MMRLPKEKIIFTVDWMPISGIQFREMADTYVPGHGGRPEEGDRDGLDNAESRAIRDRAAARPAPRRTRENELDYLHDLSAAVKKAVEEGKSYDEAEKDIKLPKYENLAELQSVPADEHRALLRFLESRDLSEIKARVTGTVHGRTMMPIVQSRSRSTRNESSTTRPFGFQS